MGCLVSLYFSEILIFKSKACEYALHEKTTLQNQLMKALEAELISPSETLENVLDNFNAVCSGNTIVKTH